MTTSRRAAEAPRRRAAEPPIRLLTAFAAAALVLPSLARAQSPAPLQDNGFLVEEAYNQDPGVTQHVLTVARHENGETLFSFGTEWPIGGMRHQLSLGFPIFCPCGEAGRDIGLGDVELAYRYQAVGLRGGPLHVAPEIAASLPTGNARFGRGGDALGVGVTIPASLVLAPWLATHANAGFALAPGTESAAGRRITAENWLLGGAVVLLPVPLVNVALEGIWESQERAAEGGGSVRESAFTLAPGVRAALDVRGVRIVPGLAMPVTFAGGEHDTEWLLYFSVEHSFR